MLQRRGQDGGPGGGKPCAKTKAPCEAACTHALQSRGRAPGGPLRLFADNGQLWSLRDAENMHLSSSLQPTRTFKSARPIFAFLYIDDTRRAWRSAKTCLPLRRDRRPDLQPTESPAHAQCPQATKCNLGSLHRFRMDYTSHNATGSASLPPPGLALSSPIERQNFQGLLDIANKQGGGRAYPVHCSRCPTG